MRSCFGLLYYAFSVVVTHRGGKAMTFKDIDTDHAFSVGSESLLALCALKSDIQLLVFEVCDLPTTIGR